MTPLKVALFAGWFGLPLLCAASGQALGGKYILQDSGRGVLWSVAAALVWLLLTLLIPGTIPLLRSPKAILAFVLWTVLVGWYAGGLAICVVNCVGDRSEARLAPIAKVDRTVGRRIVVTIADPSPGVVFSCPQAAWLEGEAAGKRFFVHTGRLGLLWGELR